MVYFIHLHFILNNYKLHKAVRGFQW